MDHERTGLAGATETPDLASREGPWVRWVCSPVLASSVERRKEYGVVDHVI